MKKIKKLLSFTICLLLVVSMTACSGGSNNAATDTSYTMWIYGGADSTYYSDFNDNPVMQYATSKTYGPENKKVNIDFWVPAIGSEQDNYQTMIASGDYADVIDGSFTDTAITMYEQGIILDLTDYVKEYMPNYLAYIEEHPEVKSSVISEIDGEEKYLGITGFAEDYDNYWCGYQYRRDWIVQYGTNPQTGAAFTGGYTDPDDMDSWEDDVVFPSGESDPVYISDWEWMFDIFTKAQEDLGITDSYSLSIYYPGYTWSGDLCSCFGGGNMLWSKNEEGEVEFGGTTDHIRAYFECMNSWYENGWLDQEFNERTGDQFYAIDDVSVRQGKVGMWIGLESQLGGRMDTGDELTTGICVYGSALPINDIYGTEDCKNKEPNCTAGTSLTDSSCYITTSAKNKDIATLCSFFDSFYTIEGGLMRTIGLNAEQVEEIDNQIYKDNGLEDGAYTVQEDGTYRRSDILTNDSGTLAGAVNCSRIPGITIVTSIDKGYADTFQASLDRWVQYKNTAGFMGTTVNKLMTNEDITTCNDIRTKILEYMEQKSPDFIKGVTDINNDDDWSTWCKMLEKYNYQKASDIYQPYADKIEF